MQACAVSHSDVLAAQGQSSLYGNDQNSHLIQGMNAPRLNRKVKSYLLQVQR